MGCLLISFFAFLPAGEFMCPSLANFGGSVMLAVGDVAMDSRTQPSYISVRLKTIHLVKESPCTLDGPTKCCVRSRQCWLTWRFALQLQVHSLFLGMAEFCLGSGWSLSSQLHCRKLGLTPHHTRVTAFVLEQPLQWLRLG